MEWQTGNPVTGKEIDFERDDQRGTYRGVLTESLVEGKTPPDHRGGFRQLYALVDDDKKSFAVVRWRAVA